MPQSAVCAKIRRNGGQGLMMSGLEEEELGRFLLWSCYNFILDYLDVDSVELLT